MRLSGQEIVNALCINIAARKMIQPDQVDVELMWDDDYGFSAEVFVGERNQILIEASIHEAIEQYVYKEYNIRIFRDQIQLVLTDEDIEADINVD
ncbi:DUF2653 family protein [Paenibacillus albiflavus]|uniref:DUF2653 family protein n=1 Tax=Paenibacillus albiflavus TaxID=2545760 RepID=A0A4R4EMK5_9BACL|nr:DUF2653 family protein [Paenibacillus albiflavus]TCZ81077.1 DUF2653 family protein [Paenibacillus albiflavus]